MNSFIADFLIIKARTLSFVFLTRSRLHVLLKHLVQRKMQFIVLVKMNFDR